MDNKVPQPPADPFLEELRAQGLGALVSDEERYFCTRELIEQWPLEEGEIPDDVKETLASFVTSGIAGWQTENRIVSKDVRDKALKAMLEHLEETRDEDTAIPFLLGAQQQLIDAGIITALKERK